MVSDSLLEVRDLVVEFKARRGGALAGRPKMIRAVDEISLSIKPGETLGIFGESGSGKSTLARTIVGLQKPTSGTVLFDGVPQKPGVPIGRDVHMVFQDPFSSLNPRLPIWRSIAEPLLSHESNLSSSEIDDRVAELLTAVQLPRDMAHRRPSSMSGGQLQRVGIARALALRPRLIVADEPVSALDVSVQAQILNLMADLREELGLAYLFIGHNLAVVERVSHRIAVMAAGEVVEFGMSSEVINNPQHPYTKSLISAVPMIEGVDS